MGPSADTLVISQTNAVVTIEERFGSIRNTLTYPVDGKTVTNRVGAGRGEGGAPVSFTSRWKDDYLLATFSVEIPGAAARRYEQKITLDKSDKNLLVIETKELGTTNSRKVVYRK
jgi:hypothetical protein